MKSSVYWNIVEIAQEAYLKTRVIQQLDDYDVETFDDKEGPNENDENKEKQKEDMQQEFIKTVLNGLYSTFGFDTVKVLQDDVSEWKTPFESQKKEKEEIVEKEIQSSVIDLFNDLKLEIKKKLQDT